MKTCLLAVVLGLVLLFPRAALACDCMTGAIPQVFSATDLVFSGVVTKVRLVNAQPSDPEPPTVVELRVLRPWKGVQSASVTLHTQRNGFSCQGYSFVVGQEYLVFASRNPPGAAARYGLSSNTATYGVSLCGGTATFPHAMTSQREEEVKRLARMPLK